jgi:hypothetical protein
VRRPGGPTRTEALAAYGLAALATLAWVACSLPAGTLEGRVPADDAATPMHREAWLLVPALFLLVLGPVGVTLTSGRPGRSAVLAAQDAFVCLFAAGALTFHGGLPAGVTLQGTTVRALVVLLWGVAGLSVHEAWRLVRPRAGGGEPPPARGLRLALALLALLLPSTLLTVPGQERASLLAPFLFVAIGAGGVRLAQTERGLRRTGAILHAALAAHVLVTLRYALYEAPPRLEVLTTTGRVTLGLAVAMLALAGVLLVLLLLPARGALRAAAHGTPA